MVILILVTSPFFPFVTGGRVILKSVDLFINYFFVGYEIPDRKVDNAEIMILRERISDSKRIALTVCSFSDCTVNSKCFTLVSPWRCPLNILQNGCTPASDDLNVDSSSCSCCGRALCLESYDFLCAN